MVCLTAARWCRRAYNECEVVALATRSRLTGAHPLQYDHLREHRVRGQLENAVHGRGHRRREERQYTQLHRIFTTGTYTCRIIFLCLSAIVEPSAIRANVHSRYSLSIIIRVTLSLSLHLGAYS